jgi:hypothetical protein
MKAGILGSGVVGQVLATGFIRHGHDSQRPDVVRCEVENDEDTLRRLHHRLPSGEGLNPDDDLGPGSEDRVRTGSGKHILLYRHPMDYAKNVVTRNEAPIRDLFLYTEDENAYSRQP